MKNKTIYSLSDIDPTIINAHLEWNKIKLNSLKLRVLKTVSIVACLFILTTMLSLTSGWFLRRSDRSNPSETNEEVQIGEKNAGSVSIDSSAIVYAKNSEYFRIKNEDLYYSENLGDIRYYGELCDNLNDLNANEDVLYAVRLSGMDYSLLDCTSSNQWDKLREYEMYWGQQENDHLDEFHLQTDGSWDYAEAEHCDECAYLREQLLEAMKATDEFEMDFQMDAYLKINDMILQHVMSQGYDANMVALIPKSQSEEYMESNTNYAVILHLTKEQLVNFKPLLKLSLVFELVPQWMDTGEEVIYYDPYFRVELE